MKQIVLLLTGILLFLSSCNTKSHYIPDGLKKLNKNEIIEYAQCGTFVNAQTLFKDSLGNIISREDLSGLEKEAFFGDYYVNSADEVVEVVVRKATQQDKELINSLKEIYAEKQLVDEGEPITLIDVECSQVMGILEEVLKKDQETRMSGSGPDEGIDQENKQIVVSIIEKCGFPTAEKHGKKSVEAVFLVIQHADKKLREKYYPLIKQSAEKGDTPWHAVALMEDRMLMDKGEKQKFGSQLTMDNESGKWVVWPIENPENVNKRRAEVGLGPIEEYVRHFGVEYEVQ